MDQRSKSIRGGMLAVVVVLAASCAGGDALERIQQAATVVPQEVAGNPSCPAGKFSVKIESDFAGTHPLVAGEQVVITTSDAITFSWTSTLGIDSVIVKGGNKANVFEYPSESTGDSGLASPVNASGGPAALSHITFCLDFEVKVAKTSRTSFTRSYDWQIAKRATPTSLTLPTGQTASVDYVVDVESTGFVDSDFAASGTISVTNPAPFPATVVAVTDTLPGASVLLTCPGLPAVLAPGGLLECQWQAALADASTLLNTATVTTTGAVGGGSAEASVSFALATITSVADCVDVTDSLTGALGQVCIDPATNDAQQSFPYSYTVGPFAVCEPQTVVNTASFAGGGKSGSASATVAIDVTCPPPPPQGCTLTPGYWKTHSSYGPAPYDDTWASLPSGADTLFYLSGRSYYVVLRTAPAGNAYYILAHAFIAAQLNGLGGASTSAITSELDTARSLLETYTPAQIAAQKGGSPLRRQITEVAGTLDRYNNGLVGPPHCPG